MKLYYSTVSSLLFEILQTLMARSEFSMFRLVGGTSLGLFRGHRMSIDIDLFTDEEYYSVDFKLIDYYLRKTYSYVDTNDYHEISMGKSYYIGESQRNCIKLDLYYTDRFVNNVILVDNIRLASVEEIIAMKLDIIMRIGRKKDFWDINELKDSYSIEQMALFHEQRYPFSINKDVLRKKRIDFSFADEDFDPVCLRGKHWELIKLDMIDLSKELIG